MVKRESNKVILGTLMLFCAVLLAIMLLENVSAADLNIKLNGKLSYYNSDFYALTNSNSASTYDGYDAPSQPIQTNDSRFFSWCRGPYSASFSWTNCSFSVDSFPASNRTIYLVYRLNPALSGTLNVSWDSSAFGSTYSAVITDYGTDYNYAAAVSPGYDMKSNSYYVASTGSAYRYFTMNVSYFPSSTGGPGGPSGCTLPAPSCTAAADLACGTTETKSANCAGDGCSSTGEKCSTGKECVDGQCVESNCTATCDSLDFECGTQTVCGASEYCGSCTTGICNNLGKCVPANCTSPCSSGDQECSGGSAFKTCSDLNNDNCYEWGSAINCPPDQICTAGECASSGCLNDDNCPEDYQCINYECIPLECADTCASLGYECGSACSVDCGSCGLGYICSSGNCEEGLPPEIIPEYIFGSCKSECSYSFICGEWSACSAEYEVSDLLGSASVTGMQTRTCADKYECCPFFVENQTCDFKEEVFVETRDWCGQNYTEVKDKKGNVLARLSIGESISGESAASIDFNVGGEGYCPYCYDGLKNYDETGVDCGGSCITCELKEEMILKKFKLPFWKATWFAILLLVLLAIALITLAVYIMAELYKEYRDSRLFGKWSKKYYAWRRSGYDAEVLNRDFNILGQKAGVNHKSKAH